MHKVEILIPVYNNKELTEACLASVLEHTPPIFKIIIIDDCSNEEASSAYYSSLSKVSEIKVIKNSLNQGFIHSINNALEYCTAKYLVILNNDTLVEKGWIENLLNGLEKDPEAGLVAPLLNCNNPYQTTENCRTSDYHEAPYIYGTCFMIRRDLLEENVLFDDIYGEGYFEDIDLCFKLITSGYKVIVANKAIIHHKNCGTFGAERAEKLIRQNYTTFYYRWAKTKLFQYIPPYLKFEITADSFKNNHWDKNHPLFSLFFYITDKQEILKIKKYLDKQIYNNFNLIIYNPLQLDLILLKNYSIQFTEKDLDLKNLFLPNNIITGEYLVNFKNHNFYGLNLPEIYVQIIRNTSLKVKQFTT